MENSENQITLKIESTSGICPAGEKIAGENIYSGKVPVLSCEGACIRGEIARLAANMVAREDGNARGCHGELFTVPNSKMAEWIKGAKKVVMIDGCFLRCHGRIIDQQLCPDKIQHFDALSHYKKYSDLFSIDAVPEEERVQTARQVADWVIDNLEVDSTPSATPCCCC